MTMNKAYEYCKNNIDLETTPRYVRLQMLEFLNICDGKSEKYIFSKSKYKQLENILKLLIMPKGLKAGQTLYECSVGYQWFLYSAILCVVHKDNPNNNYYIRCGGNNKTYIIMKEFYESVDISLHRKLEKYTLLKNSRSK